MAPREKDVDDYCRLCALEVKNGLIIYSSEGITLSLEEKIVQCLRIEVSKDDMLPKKVCEPCHVRLEDCHRFAEQASEVQHTLQLLLQMAPSAASDKESDIKDEIDDVHVKEEMVDLPLDVTLDSDVDSHTDNKETIDDEHSTEDVRSTTASPSPGNEQETTPSPRCDRRRKMLQPQRASKRRRSSAQSVKYTPSSCEDSDEERPGPEQVKHEEEYQEDEEEQQQHEEEALQELKLEDDEMDELSSLRDVGLQEDGRTAGETADDSHVSANPQDWRKTHWGIKCDHCEQLFPFKSHFDSHYRSTYGKKPVYMCSFCNKTMEKYSTFRSHCYRHVTEGRFRCEHCEKGFSLRSLLRVHVLAKHTTVKPFICEECGKGFVTRPGLNIHQKKHKFSERADFPCKECGKILHTRGGLTAHQNVHRLGRRFMCDVCGKTFTQKVNMQQHVKHHTGERPYACEKCGKCFAEKSHLNRHYSFHSEKRPFQCKVCMKNYKTERCLKVHSMVHTDARPHVCTYCSKGFLSTTKLKQHYNIHTGERPYACKFCERTFTNYPNWLKHTRRRHKSEPGAMRTGQAVAQAPGPLGPGAPVCELPDESLQSAVCLGDPGGAPYLYAQPQGPLFPDHMLGLHMLPM
ncbi:zinc finger protein 260-like isoform X2 [Bacillus rossius redtenbacheri]|uniref:zinc finger protein 260-like isoform X2 n=1 Tax=Bacillus rossius redtenbacheri TaxID=93214 RepID=UPI002FDCCE1A